ncbi:MAG: diacylglycerol kinase family lipid kinase [Gammaproteobacteria bacterium]|nr:diacylglycerol kinase family lipid kinase [Gammaproteobacteria bacterium]MDH4313748.1 diacylglycerol kinase family lipid kinase [Gammaproteobacteria bacterium]MDH5213468.1 diacylglycerol kinase family lipid kinase [Gammaproteobacteria bacterium]MDH5500250.1 diacylglycerol kinase family lipid kinase [Gammaproteobacteria bacterium]
MTSTPIPVFINPMAGRGRAGRTLDDLRELLNRQGVDHSIVQSNAVGDLEEGILAAAAAGTDRIIIAGGDGSIHEAVNGIMRSGRNVALGVIPIGTGNDFAKACGIPLHWEDAATLLADRLRGKVQPRAIDVGRMNERYFANGAGVGFDAKVTRIARSNRLPIGDLVYLIAVFQALWDGVITPRMTIHCNGKTKEGPMTLANVSNGAWVGGMFHIAPEARIDDGELDLVIADPVSRLRILRLLPHLIGGTHIGQAEISHQRMRECRIECKSPLPSHLDGEVQPLQTQFDIAILPGALRLM